jgi:hypothetical protein
MNLETVRQSPKRSIPPMLDDGGVSLGGVVLTKTGVSVELVGEGGSSFWRKGEEYSSVV